MHYRGRVFIPKVTGIEHIIFRFHGTARAKFHFTRFPAVDVDIIVNIILKVLALRVYNIVLILIDVVLQTL